MRAFLALGALIAVAAVASAQWSDDFNRPDGPIGPDWTEVSGAWGIQSQQGAHLSASPNEYMQHNTASSPYATSVVRLDVFAPGSGSQFSGVLIGLGGAEAIMVKIQDQVSGTPGFSHIGIYRGSGSTYGAWTGTGTGFAALTAPFLSARMTVHFPDPDTIVADLDTDFDGVPDQTYSKTGVTTVGPLGTSHGICGWGATALFDNWSVTDTGGGPPIVTYCTPGTSTNGCLASISATAQPSVSQASPCVLSVTDVEGQRQGVFFYGINNTGFTPASWGSGSTSFFCVKGPSQRMSLQNSGGTNAQCDGAFVQDWDAFLAFNPGALGAPFAIGSKLFVQSWYRDPPAPRTTNLSNAIELTYGP